MDSDDWAEKTMLQDMVDLAEKNDSERQANNIAILQANQKAAKSASQ